MGQNENGRRRMNRSTKKQLGLIKAGTPAEYFFLICGLVWMLYDSWLNAEPELKLMCFTWVGLFLILARFIKTDIKLFSGRVLFNLGVSLILVSLIF